MTRLRGALLSGVSLGLGAMVSVGLRLTDSPVGLVSTAGCTVVLGAALAIDLIGGSLRLRRDLAALREDVASLHGRVDKLGDSLATVEGKVLSIDGNARMAARAAFASRPSWGGADDTGSGPATSR